MAEGRGEGDVASEPARALLIGLLGPMIVARDGVELSPGTLRQRALLALLAVNARTALALDTIVDALWGDELPDQPDVSVRSYVSNLRRVLEPDRTPRSPARLLVTSGSGYRLDVPDAAVDALVFAAHATTALRCEHAGDPSGALDAAVAAQALWRGPAFVDVQGAPFAAGAATRLEADRDRVELVRLRSLVDLSRSAEALGPLTGRHDSEPTDEATAALLMRALYALGRPTDALDRYGDVRRGLADRGLLPSPALQDLERQILQHDVPSPAPGLATLTTDPVVSRPARPTTLVGRHDAWSRLADAVDHRGPRANWVVVLGESGAGKTFVLESLAAAIDGDTLWGNAHRDDDQPPLTMWRTVIEGLDAQPGDDLASMATEIRDRVRLVAGDRRALVVLDDVQWADPDSLRVLRLLALESRRLAATVLVAARSADGSDDLRGTLAEIMRQADVAVIELAPFGELEVGQLAEQLGVPLDPREIPSLLAASSGNPLLIRELLRLSPELRSAPLPREVTALVAARLERMPSETIDVLHIAALAGDTIDVELLGRTLDLDSPTVLSRLGPAFDAAIVDAAALKFRHLALRDAVLLDLDRSATRHLHLRLAETMSADPGRWPAARVVHHRSSARPLGDLDALVDAVGRAADDAATVGAFAEQARLLGVALAEDGLDVKTRLELTIDAAEACGRAGADLDTQAHAIAALDLAETIGDRASAARTVAVLGRGGGAWYWVPFGQHPTELLARVERAGLHADDVDRSLILATLAVGESYGPDPSRPGRLAAEALHLARRAGDPVAYREALIAASWAGFGTAPPGDLLALVDELDVLADALPPERQMLRQAFRLAAALRQGDLTASAAALNQGEVLARTHRRPAFDATFAWARATLLAARGELRAAGDAADRAQELQQQTQVYGAAHARHLVSLHHLDQAGDLALGGHDADAIAAMDDHGDLYQLQVAAARRDVVDLDAVESRLAAVLAEPPAWHRTARLGVIGMLAADFGLREIGSDIARALDPYGDELVAPGTALACSGPAALVLARLDAIAQRHDEAIDRLRVAYDAAAATGLRGWEAPLLVELAALLHRVGDRSGARDAAGRAITLARHIGQPGFAARAARYLDSV